MKKIKLLLIMLVLITTVPSLAQNNQTKAIIEFEEAENNFQNKNYSKTITHLENAKTLLGSTYEKIEYIEIIALYELFNYNRDYKYEDLQQLRTLIQHYNTNYSTVDIEKYKDIYAIENALKNYPKSLQEYNNIKFEQQEKIRLENERIAQEIEAKKQELERQKQIKEEQLAKQRALNAKYEFSSFGYYGGTKSPYGLSLAEGKRGFNYGISFRTNFLGDNKEIYKDDKTNFVTEQDLNIDIEREITFVNSTVFLFNIGTSLAPYVHTYLGVGYGSRKALVRNANASTYFKDENNGVETELGLFIITGNFGVLRLGYSKVYFGESYFIDKKDLSEITFGYLFSF